MKCNVFHLQLSCFHIQIPFKVTQNNRKTINNIQKHKLLKYIYIKKKKSILCAVFSIQKPNLVSLPFDLEEQKKVQHMEEGRQGFF